MFFDFLLLVCFLYFFIALLFSLLFFSLLDMTTPGYNYQSHMHVAALSFTAARIYVLIS